ncbi:hypothetical protein CDAR_454751 [Caerostris darwini]|uniref:Uncharacterized protein n=1 Tax=Caerostris darwini TaxID=1538125 RepID=A0AAV4TY14_9ARAC|nr:hypothetical protein CDAR_454751 [Caerostris darwini]
MRKIKTFPPPPTPIPTPGRYFHPDAYSITNSGCFTYFTWRPNTNLLHYQSSRISYLAPILHTTENLSAIPNSHSQDELLSTHDQPVADHIFPQEFETLLKYRWREDSRPTQPAAGLVPEYDFDTKEVP